jgi:hypothetical protein
MRIDWSLVPFKTTAFKQLSVKVQGLLQDSPGPRAKGCLTAKAWAADGLPKHKCIQEIL